MTPKKIIKGRTFNHRDGESEGRLFDMEHPVKARTAKEVAEEICKSHDCDDGWCRNNVAQALTAFAESEVEAYAEREEPRRMEADAYLKKQASAEGYEDGLEEAAKASEQCDCGDVCGCSTLIARKIRALRDKP